MTAAHGEQADQSDTPLVIRSSRLRLIGVVTSVLLTALALLGWFALPPEIKALFTPWQRIALLGILAVIIFLLATMAASYVKADSTGLRIRNGLRRHDVPWSRVHKILLRPGDPWAQLLLKPAGGGRFEADLDAEKQALMGIQTTDGAPARAAVEELRRRLRSSRAQ
jgi:Bacterial PH domain